MNSKDKRKLDPLKRQAEVSAKDRGEELSPMSPPTPGEKSVTIDVAYKDMHPYFQELMDEHQDLKQNIAQFKQIVQNIEKDPKSFPSNRPKLLSFFDYFEQEFVAHNRKEEKHFFPIMHERLLESGEHSSGPDPFTGVDILMDEHIQAIKIYSALRCLTEQIPNIPTEAARKVLLGEIIRLSKELTELIELHIEREDHIIFGLAMKLLSKEDLEKIST